MAYKINKSGPSAMYGPKAMKKGATAMKDKGAMAMKRGPMASKQSPAEHYAMNARHDMKTGEGTKKDIAYDIKKASEYGYMSSVHKVKPHKRGATAMYDGPKAMYKGPKAMKEGPMAMSKTDKGIKGLGSSNKSGGKYI